MPSFLVCRQLNRINEYKKQKTYEHDKSKIQSVYRIVTTCAKFASLQTCCSIFLLTCLFCD